MSLYVNKGQTTFEFIVIMVVIIIFASLAFFAFSQRINGILLGAVKEKILEKYPGCQFSLYLDGNIISIKNSTCAIDKEEIAYEIEKAFCGQGDKDNVISCYGVSIE